jgi:hypothetical protein
MPCVIIETLNVIVAEDAINWHFRDNLARPHCLGTPSHRTTPPFSACAFSRID